MSRVARATRPGLARGAPAGTLEPCLAVMDG
jgi:hypothetical protein